MDRCRIPQELIETLKTPAYVVDKGLIEQNLKILASVQHDTGAKILLALKGFAMFAFAPLVKKYLSGVSASSLNEARLGYEEFDASVHIVSPAYRPDEFDQILKYVDHVVFNSFDQWKKYKKLIEKTNGKVKPGLRINPQYSEIKTDIYNPCAKFSRLGITIDQFKNQDLTGITGLHFHTMCEQNSDTLEKTVEVVEEKFGTVIEKMQWLNLGGGHHITRPDYDIKKLCSIIKHLTDRYNIEVFLEPGEAIALNTGVLITTVLDIVHNQMDIAILDTSVSAHMPDVIEMPYTPQIVGAAEPGKFKHTYRLAGPSCLAGDILGDYSFQRPIKVGDKLILLDMAHYTMVKNNTFNGVNLPQITIFDPQKQNIEVIRTFGYDDYRNRLS